MYKKFKKGKGAVLFLVLIITLVLTMFTCSLVSLNRQNLVFLSHYRDVLAAQQMAQAGANHVLYRIFLNPGYSTDINYTCPAGDLGYRITFNPSAQNHSVNNLNNPAVSSVANYEGRPVPATTADIVVVGISRMTSVPNITHRVRIVLKREINFDRSVGAIGRVRLYGNVNIGGVSSMMSDAPIGGGIHSNSNNNQLNPVITWDRQGTGTFLVQGQTIISTVPGRSSNSSSIQQNIKDACPNNYNENAAVKNIPDIDVRTVVQQKSSCAEVQGTTRQRGGYYSNAQYINDERYIKGNLTINGDLNLGNGTLYVEGNLTINGGIKGFGAVYVSGRLNINGGNSTVVTNQMNAASLFAGGDITVTGQSTSGYLLSLATQYPDTIGANYYRLMTALNGLNTALGDNEVKNNNQNYCNSFPGYNAATNSGYSALFYARPFFVDDHDPTTATLNLPPNLNSIYTIPIPEPDDGSYSTGSMGAYIPALIQAIKNEPGAGYSEDPTDPNYNESTVRAVRALEELAYFFRNGDFDSSFHDNTLPIQSQSLDHLFYHVQHTSNFESTIRAYTGNRGLTKEEFVRNVAMNYLRYNNPLSEDWGSDSYIQGLVYSKGNITFSNNLRIYGSVLTRNDVNLTNSSLIFCEEYMRIFGGAGPVRIMSYREL